MAGKVIAIGETVLDIVFRDGRLLSACPGGSMLNSAVSLGRAGDRVVLLSETGTDAPGRMIRDFLKDNEVELVPTSSGDAKTILAIATLDGTANATYNFYKEEKRDRRITFPITPGKGDIVLFGSFYSLEDEPRDELVRFLNTARANGAILIYDPNFRSPHEHELGRVMPRILENLSLSHLVRGSDEDFHTIFGAGDAKEAYSFVARAGCRIMIYTKNKAVVEFRSPEMSFSMKVPEIEPVSTIGAGDAFNAGIVHELLKERIAAETLAGMTEETWRTILKRGTRFASAVCLSEENYIPPDLDLSC